SSNHLFFFLCFFNATAPSHLYTLSLHDALPICVQAVVQIALVLQHEEQTGQSNGNSNAGELFIGIIFRQVIIPAAGTDGADLRRSEEHTSELQSRFDLVCRLLLEKKKKNNAMNE